MGFRAAIWRATPPRGQSFGVINLLRFAVGSFNEKQIELVQTFADQAVIAIGNVRLFDQVQARTQELDGVAGAADRDIRGPERDQPLRRGSCSCLRRDAGKAMQLCGTHFGVLNTFDGELFHTAATYRLSSRL